MLLAKNLKFFLACVFYIDDWDYGVLSLTPNCSCGTLEKSVGLGPSLQKDKMVLVLYYTIEVL